MEKNLSKTTNDSKLLLKFVKKLIAFQSTEEHPEEIVSCLSEIENEFGSILKVKRYRFRKRPILLLSTHKDKEADIILAGHIDVVPAKKEEFIPREDNERIYGRGAIDMKSAVGACLFAVKKYVKEGGKAKIIIIITSDEELDGLSMKWLAEKMGYRSRLAILPDGGDETALVSMQKGLWQIRVDVRGRSSHASRPWEGDNPIEKGFALCKKLQKMFPLPENKREWKTSIALTKVEGGKALNQIPDSATFYFDIRYTDELMREKITKTVTGFLGEASCVETIAQNGALIVDQKNPLILKLKVAMEKELQKKVSFINECGTSDAIFFAEQGTPAILFRPRGGGMHQDGEWIDTKSLIQFQVILLDFLRNI